MPKSHVYFWSDIPDHRVLGIIPKRSMEPTATDHAEEVGGLVCRLGNLRGLEEAIISYAYDGYIFDFAAFFAHGGPGGIAIGTDVLDVKTLSQFKSKGYNQIFKKDANIDIIGCNVAEGAIGEYFMVDMARTFLGRNGGRLRANTGVGLNIGSIPHPFGDWVTATASSGGGVQLNGHTHLDRALIEKRIKAAALRITNLMAGNKELGKRSLEEAELAFEKATKFVDPPADPNSHYNLFYACYYLDIAEDKIRLAQELKDTAQIWAQPKF